MATFGRFSRGEKTPVETYEGDSIALRDNDYVQVLEKVANKGDVTVAFIKLVPGESVRSVRQTQ